MVSGKLVFWACYRFYLNKVLSRGNGILNVGKIMLASLAIPF
jgi:hypothetical protein